MPCSGEHIPVWTDNAEVRHIEFLALAATYLNAAAPPSDERARTAIERLHAQDIAATLTDDADHLTLTGRLELIGN